MTMNNMMINIIIIIMAGDGNRVEGRPEICLTTKNVFFPKQRRDDWGGGSYLFSI